MTRWEYTTLALPAAEWGYDDFDALARFGADGWEAYAVTREERELPETHYEPTAAVVYHLKRPLKTTTGPTEDKP